MRTKHLSDVQILAGLVAFSRAAVAGQKAPVEAVLAQIDCIAQDMLRAQGQAEFAGQDPPFQPDQPQAP